MRYALLNLLACPMCRNFPLKLYVLEEVRYDKEFKVNTPFCDVYCGLLGKPVKEVGDKVNCRDCVKRDIIAGVLVCANCGRWYPIVNGIPMMYPDEKRKHPNVRGREEEFIQKYKDVMPEELKKVLKLTS